MQSIIRSVLCVAIALTTIAQSQSLGGTAAGSQYNIAGTAGRVANVGGSSGVASVSSAYVIGPSDVLLITTWKEPELSQSTPVRPDGKIALPLIGEIQAAGSTADQLRDLIAAKLKDYIEHPVVNVVVHEIHSQTFNLLGKVVRPGSYPLDKPTTVLDAIAVAGGFQDFAKLSKIYVLRRSPGGAEVMLAFNYKRVIKGESITDNIQLRPGDTVVVP